jgi:hypothetical protein
MATFKRRNMEQPQVLSHGPSLEQLYYEGWINLQDVDYTLVMGNSVSRRKRRKIRARPKNHKSPFMVS